jgi:hypothetical protein
VQGAGAGGGGPRAMDATGDRPGVGTRRAARQAPARGATGPGNSDTNCFCHMSSVRSTSDGRGPVTRKRVPDREEQGKPSEDARHGRYHSLE